MNTTTMLARAALLFGFGIFGFAIAGCGGGGSGDGSGGDSGGGGGSFALGQVRDATPNVVQTIVGLPNSDRSGALGSVGTARSIGTDEELARLVSIPLDSSFNCTTRGGGTLTGALVFDDEAEVLEFTIETVSILSDCDGVSGTVNLIISGAQVGDQLVSQTAIGGAFSATVSEVGICGYATDGLFVDITTDADGNLISSTFSGNLASVCEGITVSCSWSNVNPQDSNSILSGCSFSE